MGSRIGKNSIGKGDFFGLLTDMVKRQQSTELNMSNLSLRKIYASVAAMNADVVAPIGDDGEKVLKGQLVVISAVGADMGKVYRYSENVWEYVGQIGDLSGKANNTDVVNILGDFSNLQYSARTSLRLTYDAASKKLKVVGSTTTGNTEIVVIKYNGLEYAIKGASGTEFSMAGIVSGHTQIGFLTTVATPTNVQLSDFVYYNDDLPHTNFIKLAHLTYNEGLTSKIIFDYNKYATEQSAVVATADIVKLKADYSDMQYSLMTGLKLTYDIINKKLKIVGSTATGYTNVLRIFHNGIVYDIKGASGSEFSMPGVIAGNTQIGFLTTVATPTNVQLSDFVFYNDALPHTDFIKLAHLTFNEVLTSKVISDYKIYSDISITAGLATDIAKIKNDFSNLQYSFRTGLKLTYDIVNKKLKIVGSTTTGYTDVLVVTYNNVEYYIKGVAGFEFSMAGIVAGNTQIGFLTTVADRLNVQLSDFVFYNDAGIHANFVKLAHLTYNEGLTSKVISDYQTYINQQKAASPIVLPASFMNNSIGENCFAAGVRNELKILGFGNSFMRNSVHYLSAIAKGAGVDLTIGNLYTGGTNLANHLSAMNSGSNPYEWYKYENGVNTTSLMNQTAQFGLKNERWDAVILHQYTPWTQPFEPYLTSVILKIIEILGYCPKFYLNSTWAGHEDYVSEQYGFTTELEMWDYMLNATKQACVDSGIILNSIIPTGTAIQNARTLAYADSYNRFTNGGTDWHHLNPAGGFIAACTIYEKIIYPLNGVHCSSSTYRIPVATNMPPDYTTQAGILVTDVNYLSMCQSAIDASANPNEVTNQ